VSVFILNLDNMATVTKKILNLINERDNDQSSPDFRVHLQSLKEEIEKLKIHEIDAINRTYMTGYMDKESNRRMKGNYYKETYEPFVFYNNKEK
jgi:hypothetical protein